MNLQKLQDLRIDKNLTMKDVAEILKIAKGTYSLWEEGMERFPLERLVELCDYYLVSIDYIFDLSKEISYINIKNGIDKNLLASNIKNIRKKANLTQVKFASLLNLGRTTIINYESGNSIPLIDHIYFLAKRYNISIDFLLGRINYIPDWCNNYLKK